MQYLAFLSSALLAFYPVAAQAGEAVVRETTLDIPTYAIGPEDKNPPLWKPNVYPYSMQTDITQDKTAKSYRAVILENDYIRVIILPDLGGRIYAAHDKTNSDADFIYRNHVIKPGLVALRGAWLSGGIEWNFPTRGHTVNTFSPVQYKILKGEDGSVTCVVGTIEWVRRMKWAVATTVYPDRSYFCNRILLFNRTLTHNNGYFWANAAVHIWSDTRVTLPPTDYTYFGSRRDPKPWPICRGKDVSWYKNTHCPYDYFCGVSGGYIGAYHHERDYGTAHYAAKYESFGKKFFTWGTSRDGAIWGDILTDADGQYIELQSGRLLTQGDCWIFEPHLNESWEEYWYPLKKMKGVVKLNREAAVNYSLRDGKLLLVLNTTTELRDAMLKILADGKEVFSEKLTIGPGKSWQKEIAPPEKPNACRLVLQDRQGREIIAYCPGKKKIPPPEFEPRPPSGETASAEEIYLAGYYALKHWKPTKAIRLFQQALKKAPGFTPALRGLAIVYYKTGRFKEAYQLSQKALRRNEDDHTARYYRALSKIKLGIDERTEEDLVLVGRTAAYRHVAPYVLASLAIGKGDLRRAERLLRQAVRHNPGDIKARAVLASVLRHLGRREEAVGQIDSVLAEDPINCLAIVEKVLLGGESELAILRDDPQYYLEAACDYVEMNLPDDAVSTLKLYEGRSGAAEHPFVYFFLGYLADKSKDCESAKNYYDRGARLSPDYVFPFRNESLAVLETGIRYLPNDWKLHYYLGTLLTAKFRWQEGLDHFLAAQKASPDYPTLYRNLGEIYWRKLNDLKKAQTAYEKTLACNPNDYSYYVALDCLYAALGCHEKRAKLFAGAPPAVAKDFRVLLRQAVYCVDVAQYDKALGILRRHTFHPWEGWTGAQEVYVRALHLRADSHVKQGNYKKAIEDLRQAMEYPENLGTGKPHDPNYIMEYCKLGLCFKALGKLNVAREHFTKAAAYHCGPAQRDRDWHARALEELEKLKGEIPGSKHE